MSETETTEDYFNDLIDEFQTLEEDVVKETKSNATSLLSSAVVAGLSTYLMKGNEPFYQVGIMGVSQFVSENMNRFLIKQGYSTDDKNMKSVVTVLMSTSLYSLINRQSRLNEDMMKNLEIGLLSSASGEALQKAKDKYTKEDKTSDCQITTTGKTIQIEGNCDISNEAHGMAT